MHADAGSTSVIILTSVINRTDYFGVTDLLENFRKYMSCLDAAADPHLAISRGLYVPKKGRSLADGIAGRLEIQPASAHLVVGGIGSGKTTQLLLATQRLKKSSDTIAEYIDISAVHDINLMGPQILLSLVGLSLKKKLTGPEVKELAKDFEAIRRTAEGYSFFIRHQNEPEDYQDEPEDYEEDGEYVEVPGVLRKPPGDTPPSYTSLIGSLKRIHEKLRTRYPHIVFLFDSLDRIVDMDGFEKIVSEDVRILRSLGIGVVLVSPLKTLYGAYRPIVQRFDSVHQVQWSDPEEPAGREFLFNVLQARAPQGLLSDAGATRLAELSGGVLRDLIGIARNAGEEAYLSNDDVITEKHAEIVGDAYGRTLLLGTNSDDIKKLQLVREQSKFVPVTDNDLALLMTGRVLEYRGVGVRYAVHPTIRPLLDQITE
jgi:energy-coupling factor transporter ATP-binding protein EcfA2